MSFPVKEIFCHSNKGNAPYSFDIHFTNTQPPHWRTQTKKENNNMNCSIWFNINGPTWLKNTFPSYAINIAK